jgi:2-oxoglutarate dehydrogenase E1 component
MSALLDLLRSTSAYSGGNAAFIEGLYERYLQDPQSVDPGWRRHFDELQRDLARARPDVPHEPVRASFARLARERRLSAVGPGICLSPIAAEKQAAVLRLINAHRVRGHQHARLDPLGLSAREEVPDLDPLFHHLGPADMDTVFNTGSLYAPDRMALRDILALVRDVYCGTLGSEYMHITDTAQKRWIQKRVEGYRGRPEITAEGRRWLLTLLTAGEGLEKYLHARYVGQKRFSLEGAEAVIPLLDELIQRAGTKGVQEMVIGMAHRGRLTVLTNILGKPPEVLFAEFEGRHRTRGVMSSGDVKYHMGFSCDIDTPGGVVHVALGFNPSHLEIIGPVIEGSVRARQHRRHDTHGERVLPVLIHGDAAFAGQGVVMETFNMSQARGYATGGTVHIVINNQIGFTTSNPLDSRSTLYCTDVGKMVQAPIFHVNGDDPEAVIFATRLAFDFRNQFHKDVIIDVVCYRRHGHNEADEPAVTQPLMYHQIRHHPTVRASYAQQLIAEGIVTPQEAQALVESYRSSLEQGVVLSRPVCCSIERRYSVNWDPFHGARWDHPARTRVNPERFRELALRLLEVPPGFEPHPRASKILEDRRKMATGDQLADWGFGETMAYATLLDQGHPIRLSGQDSGRGTFFHRHAVLHDQKTGDAYVPLRHLREGQPDFTVIDSLLSEEAVLAFEYGYATAEPHTLTLWEAQFGDFANNAQVVIDQFISSAGAKWGLYCGLVMLLPHGYEGQGPEHSSGRIERYMQLCAEENIQVCVPSTPAQIFHLLRRQMLRPYRHPLIVFTPKSLLRHRLATSTLDELHSGAFQPVIDETDSLDPRQVTQIVLCAGKVYYDLLEARRTRSIRHVAIARVEQLYPFPKEQLAALFAGYPALQTVVWCQEEPQNQGAWDQIKHRLRRLVGEGRALYYVGRHSAAAPSTGYRQLHVEQQETLVDEALSGRFNPRMNRRIPA